MYFTEAMAKMWTNNMSNTFDYEYIELQDRQ